MKLLRYLILTVSFFGLTLTAAPCLADAAALPASAKIAIVDFKKCVEQSKFGKQEQGNFEALKKQMEKSLEEKEKELTDMASKFNDPDYLDSLSPEAETELKRKFRAMSQEMQQVQGQFYQTLQQTNFKIIQSLQEEVNKASVVLREKHNIDDIRNSEGSFSYNPKLDVSAEIITIMDQKFEKDKLEDKEAKPGEVK